MYVDLAGIRRLGTSIRHIFLIIVEVPNGIVIKIAPLAQDHTLTQASVSLSLSPFLGRSLKRLWGSPVSVLLSPSRFS